MELNSSAGKDKSALIERLLKELPVFKSLSNNYLSRIAKDFIVFQAKKGETVFYQSDSSTDLYIVLDGAVRASLLNQEGQELVLATFDKGDFFGEMSLLDGKPRSATMIAVEDSALGMLKRERFLSAVKNDPMIAIDLLSAVVQRLRMADGMIESLAFLDVSQRLMKLLLQIAKAEGEKDKSGFFRIKKLTHKELAARTGASREAISKVIKVLAFKDVVREEGDCLLISPEAESGM
ncbi:MAG: Crp/Fnr family transcriptional regulator [Nitrospirae bacterium]|nr:Crp/Fnr family transcriptional regulator [Nitrospirota bacterium]MBI3376943.1 Crp/Fnr family transcriptional regulator [Nitrospirota bacterium]